MPGPPPKPPYLRRRRNPTPGFKLLPHEGRTGKTPDWPLLTHPVEEVAEIEQRKWADLWSLPQAVEWERMRSYDDVALYVRVFVEASRPEAGLDLLAELRQLDLKIGVSPKAMQQLRWETDEPEPVPIRSAKSARRRLVVAE